MELVNIVNIAVNPIGTFQTLRSFRVIIFIAGQIHMMMIWKLLLDLT